MKEQKLIEISNKVDQLGAVAQKLITELSNLKDLSVGTLETVKLLPGYKEAIEELINKNTKDGKEDSDSTTRGDRKFINPDQQSN